MTSAVHRAADSPTVWLSGDVYNVTVRGEATGGALSLTDGWVPPGGGPPPHVHLDATELIYVHTGELAIVIGDIECIAGPGDAAVITPGTVHWFRNRTTAPARVLFVFTPPGTEEFFIQAGTPACAGTAIPIATDADNARASDIGHRFGLASATGRDLPHDERTNA